jgi:hypothetical protein
LMCLTLLHVVSCRWSCRDRFSVSTA